jgi:hypothetical protein
VYPAQPFIEWAATLDDSGILPDPNGEPSIYLLPEYDDDVEGWDILSQCFDIIFDAELEGWHTLESAWPVNRTFSMFREWFHITLGSTVDDLCEGPVLDDEL